MHIDKKISEKVLTLAPDYRYPPRGGIDAVIDVYSKYFEKFNFIPTCRGVGLYRTYTSFIGVLTIMYTLLRNRNIKIVHIHGSSNGSFYRKYICFVISKHLFGKKVVYHVHSGEYHLFYTKSKKIIKKRIWKFINNVDCLVCLSEQWKQFFEENFTPKKVEVLPNIIDYPVLKGKNEDTGKIRFLFLGLIHNKKGIFDLIEVIKNNMDLFDHKIELIIGGSGEVDRLQNLIDTYQIGHIVKFVGWIQNETKTQYLQNTDVYILPSYNEGLPISILEAMSYGKPIISTNVGGIPQVVKNNENGFLINPGNLEEIGASMKYFLENKKNMEKFGSVSLKIVEQHLPNAVMQQLTDIYQILLTQ